MSPRFRRMRTSTAVLLAVIAGLAVALVIQHRRHRELVRRMDERIAEAHGVLSRMSERAADREAGATGAAR